MTQSTQQEQTQQETGLQEAQLPTLVKVATSGFDEFCKEAQKYLDMGYGFDFSTSENYPTWYGTVYFCGLKLKQPEQLKGAYSGSDGGSTTDVNESPVELPNDSEGAISSGAITPPARAKGRITKSII
jgi:hypothetical protein